MKASTRICLIQLLRIGISLILFLTALLGFLVTYGETVPFLGWMASVLFTAWLIRRLLRPLATSLMVFALSIPILWPIDAFFHYPFLRTLSALSFWGPTITAFPSPSGTCTAYVYSFGLVDRAYSVRIAHYLSFPGHKYPVPIGPHEPAGITSRWENGKFKMRVDRFHSDTLIYDEATRQVILKKKYVTYAPRYPEIIVK